MATLLDEAVARRRFSSGHGRHRAQLLAGLVVITVVAVCSLLAPLLAPYDPILTDPTAKFLPPASPGHLLGTDELGRDLLSRLLWGGRTSLLLAVAAVAAATVLGSSAALAAGFATEFNGVFTSLEDTRDVFERVRQACAAIGREPATMTWSVALALVCGPPAMVDAVLGYFNEQGIQPNSFHYERFTPSVTVQEVA